MNPHKLPKIIARNILIDYENGRNRSHIVSHVKPADSPHTVYHDGGICMRFIIYEVAEMAWSPLIGDWRVSISLVASPRRRLRVDPYDGCWFASDATRWKTRREDKSCELSI